MVTIDVPHCPEDNGTLPKDPLEAVEDENELNRIKLFYYLKNKS